MTISSGLSWTILPPPKQNSNSKQPINELNIENYELKIGSMFVDKVSRRNFLLEMRCGIALELHVISKTGSNSLDLSTFWVNARQSCSSTREWPESCARASNLLGPAPSAIGNAVRLSVFGFHCFHKNQVIQERKIHNLILVNKYDTPTQKYSKYRYLKSGGGMLLFMSGRDQWKNLLWISSTSPVQTLSNCQTGLVVSSVMGDLHFTFFILFRGVQNGIFRAIFLEWIVFTCFNLLIIFSYSYCLNFVADGICVFYSF